MLSVPVRPATTPYAAPATKTELANLRSEKTRTYANPDGTFTTEYSQGRLNYRDANGTWQPLDLSLVANNDPTFGLRVKANDATVSFGTSSGDAGLATMTAPDGTSLTLRAVNGGVATASSDHLAFAGIGGAPPASAYPADTGFEFRSTWTSAQQLPYADFAISAPGLTVTLGKGGELDLFDAKGALAGVISAPVVFQGDPDSGGAPTDPAVVSVELLPTGARVGETLVRYHVDPTWLADPSREFPVVLDPTTYCLGQGCTGSNSYASGNFDDFVDSGLPDTYPTGWPVFRVGYDVRSDDGYVFNTMRGLVFFKDVGLPDGAVVTSATLDYYAEAVYSAAGENVYAYRVSDGDGWSTAETWHKFGTGTGTGGNGDGYVTTNGLATTVPAAGNHQTWDVTAITQQWYTRRGQDWQPDLGFAMKMYHENVGGSGEVEYSDAANSTLSRRPKLSITFDQPRVGIDYAPELGTNYSPSQMLAGQATTLPIVISNNSSGFSFDTTNWRVGYRFFDKNGAVAASGSQALTASVASGSKSATIALGVTPPATPDQYTLRLDLIRTNITGGDEYVSDWAQPSLYYSRNKKQLSSDNTRWVGTSIVERDEASINVVTAAGTGGVTESVSTGDGGSLGINLSTANLTYDGAGGIGFADRLPMNLTYGYDAALAMLDCGGILAACGWFTNYDERFIATAQDEYTYQSPDGARSKVTTDADGQLLGGGGVTLRRPRVTIWDEAGLVAGQTYLIAGGGSEPTAYSGTNELKVTANASHDVTPSGFQPFDLNNYRVARFALRTGGPNNVDKAGLGFLIHNVNTGVDKWYMYTEGSADFTLSWPHRFLGYGGQTHLYGGWNTYSVALRDDVRNDGSFGSASDVLQVKGVWVQTAGLGTSSDSTYVDAWRMDPYDYSGILTDSNPSWTSASTGTAAITTDKAVGTASVEIPSHAIGSSPDCQSSSGCVTSLDLGADTFATWYWRKVGGATAALTIHVKDTSGRSGAPCSTTCDLTYFAGPVPPVGATTAIQISDTAPADWTKVTRNIFRDAQQALGLYNDANSVPDPSQPPTQGPTPDPVTMLGYRPSGVDGSYLLIDDLRVDSLPIDWAEYTHPTSSSDTTFTYDFTAAYPDGTTHYFNQDGLLTRITDRDGNAVNLDWTITRNVAGQAAYALTTIHSPTDGTTSSGATYRRQIGVTKSGSNPITVTFTELLGTSAHPATGRSTTFTVQTATGSTYGIGDVTSITPARTAACVGGGSPTGCDLFSYTDSTNHRMTRVYDPRSTGSDSNYLGITWTSGKPTTVVDASQSSTAQLNVLTWSVGGTLGPASTRVLWQNADDVRSIYAHYLDLTVDGNAIYEYIPLACGATCGTPPAAPDQTKVAVAHQFDGLAGVDSTTSFRCPGVAMTGTGCSGTTALAMVTRSATKAAAKVDNFADSLTAGETAWSQTSAQFEASLRDSGGMNPDLYRTTYSYNSLAEQTAQADVVYNPQPDYAGTINSTSHGIAYWRLDDASGNAADQSGTYPLTVTATGVTRSVAGGLLNDADTAMTFASSGSGRASTTALSISQTAYTLEAWFAVTTANQTNRGIIGDFNASGAMINLDQNGYIEIAHSTARVVSSIIPVVGRWYHVVATWDGTNLLLYVDGSIAATGSFGAEGTGATTFEIGSWNNGQAGKFVDASIDEAAYYDIALTPNQVQDHYLAGRSLAYHATETSYDAEGHPTQTDDQALLSNGFESGLGNWVVSGSGQLKTTDPASPDFTYIHGGYASYQTNLGGAVNQDVPLVPGQTFRLQAWAKTTGTAQPVITPQYWKRSTHAWSSFPSFPASEPSNSSWTSYAWDLTLPADTDGRVRVTLGVTGGSGTDSVYYDDTAVLTSYARRAYDASGRVTDTYTLATGSTAEIRTNLTYGDDAGTGVAANAHPGLWPTAAIANYIDGVEGGPGHDDDIETDRTFDGWGRTLTTTDPDGVVATTVYAANMTDVASTKDNLGNVTAMTYDPVGNLLSTTSPTGLVTNSTFDLGNDVLVTTAPDGAKTRNDYNAWGERIASWANYTSGTTGADHDLVRVYAYDVLGNVTQTDVDCSATSGVITPPCTGGLDARTTTTYDLVGTAVASTAYPGAGGTGTARTTTSYFETYTPSAGTWASQAITQSAPAGTTLPISPSASPAPICPGTASTRCSTAAVYTFNGAAVSGVDPNGRTFATTEAYGITTVSDVDIAGRPVLTIAGYVAGATPDSDTNVTTTTVYDLAGRPISSYDALNRHEDRTYDALGRVLTVSHVGNDTPGTVTSTTTTSYWPSGRVFQATDGASTTETTYDDDARAFSTIANADATDAGMAIEAFEERLTSSWQRAASGGSGNSFTTSASAAMTTDVSATDAMAPGSEYSAVPPVSGRGRLHVTTASSAGTDGVWWDLSGPAPFKAGHTYAVAFDARTSAGVSLRAFLGQDEPSGGSFAELSGGISGDGSWHRYSFSWTPGSDVTTTDVHFALRKDAAGTADFYLDNVVFWDSTNAGGVDWSQKNIVSSQTAYDDAGQVIASILPPGDPSDLVNGRPLVTTTAADPAGRTVSTVVNDVSGTYAAAIRGTTGLAAYFPLNEAVGLLAADKSGLAGTSLVDSGTPDWGVAGALDEARTAIRLNGSNGFLSRSTNVTSATTNVSLEAWVRSDTTPSDGQTHVIAENGTATNGWGLAVDASGNAAGFAISGGTLTTIGSTTKVTDGAWHHLVLERGASTWTLYIDKATPSLTNSTASPGTPGAGFSVGAQSDGTRLFVGDVDEVSVYTANTGSTATSHFDAGRRPATDTATALTTRTNYDGLGRKVDVWTPSQQTIGSAHLPVRTHAVLDRLGNQTDTWANYLNGATSSATGDDDVHSTYAYDVLGELIGYCPARQLYSPGCTVTSSSDGVAWHYTFDAMGRPTKTVPPVNAHDTALTSSESVYDTGGHLTSTCRYPAGTACASVNSRHVDFVYDALGRLLTQKTYDRTSGSDTLKFTKTLTWNADGSQASVSENGGNALSWVYDVAGRLNQFKDGPTVKTAYTYNNVPSTVLTRTDGTMGATTFAYDWAKREKTITPPSSYSTSAVTRTYRLDGTLATQAFAGSITETLSYDADKRPTQISLNTSGTASTISQAYDRGARVTADGRALTGISGDAGTGTQAFTYDGLGRVTGSTGLSKSFTYNYDLDGNRLTRTEGSTTTTFTTDYTDELYQQTISGTQKTFAYDAYGNLTTAWDNTSSSISYAYDEASRLTGITPQTGSAATLTPDALDRTKTRTVGANTDTYGYLGPSTTTYETGAATTDALLDLDGSRLAVKTGAVVSWAIFDLHGSLVALCPAGSSTLSDAYRYDAWGQTVGTNVGTTTNPWRYRGLLDVSPASSNPILAMGARFYSPSLGTFTAEDAVQGSAANPLSMNRYLYAEGNPATLIDPDGHAVLTTATLCSRYEDYCSAPSTRAGPRLVYNRDSAKYRQKSVDITAHGPRTSLSSMRMGCAACSDSQFRSGGSTFDVALDAEHERQSHYYDSDLPDVTGALSAISLVTGTLAVAAAVSGAAECATVLGCAIGAPSEGVAVALEVVSFATGALATAGDCGDPSRAAACGLGLLAIPLGAVGIGARVGGRIGFLSEDASMAVGIQGDFAAAGGAFASWLAETFGGDSRL